MPPSVRNTANLAGFEKLFAENYPKFSALAGFLFGLACFGYQRIAGKIPDISNDLNVATNSLTQVLAVPIFMAAIFDHYMQLGMRATGIEPRPKRSGLLWEAGREIVFFVILVGYGILFALFMVVFDMLVSYLS